MIRFRLFFLLLLLPQALWAQPLRLLQTGHVPQTAKPWVFWYWMKASVSKAGITADLEAMQEAGIGGAYLMPIMGPTDPPLMEPPVNQLTPEWWAMVRHAMQEAKRLGLELAMHESDGFALAGGPWITPELSMQKVVWTETQVKGGQTFQDTLDQPETLEDYYRDLAVFAFPTPPGAKHSTQTLKPTVTTSQSDVDATFLAYAGQKRQSPDAPWNQEGGKDQFRSDGPAWIQYAFAEPFTARSVLIRTKGNNVQSHRLRIEASDDGQTFRAVAQLEPPRHGWQDTDADVTHTIPPTTARYFRFHFDPAGSEPGAEDLDAAKWKPTLKIAGIELSGAPRIHQFEGKSGAVWRISPRTTPEQLPDSLCIPHEAMVDLTDHLDAQGRLTWEVPEGNWTILRMGHTSTGHTNATGGAGQGLECDKFNPEAIRKQFDGWYGEAIRQMGPELAEDVLKVFHIDSWECGSQNWSPVFRAEFQKRRGYDLLPYLPVLAGVPIGNRDSSERFLYDVRQTIAELVTDTFYELMAQQAYAKGDRFSAECVAPTMLADGMRHYEKVDIPMGEFWLRSPTHDKPNDMQDALSGAHIYGKPIVQAEAFTELRILWDEHPAMLKALEDRNYALGINRMVYHVFTHNPWLDRQPGMTLNGVGLYFQRDQTWWKPGRAWVEYAQRCQELLQQGTPVADLAVFTGEELPRRSILPDRLVPILPGLFGPERVAAEKERLQNEGQPLREFPKGVTSTANFAEPADWVNPLHGYAYDSFNKDALIRLAEVRDGRIVLPGGASYGILIIPGDRRMSPNAELMTPEVATRLLALVEAGATILMQERPERSPSLVDASAADSTVRRVAATLWDGEWTPLAEGLSMKKVGKGRLLRGVCSAETLDALGLARDLVVQEGNPAYAEDIAYTHRTGPDFDIYFLSNQQDQSRTLTVSLRAGGQAPEVYNPVTQDTYAATDVHEQSGRTQFSLTLEPHGSRFILLRQLSADQSLTTVPETQAVKKLDGRWQVQFDPAARGPKKVLKMNELQDWSTRAEPEVKYYAGTATYTQKFSWKPEGNASTRVWLDLGDVANLAEVWVNGEACGVAWTAPYRIDITKALRPGKNELRIAVTNTWANRLIGDHALPEDERPTWSTVPYILEGEPLLKAGLLGPVRLLKAAPTDSAAQRSR
ncbi:Glycosyl hydrolases family 2, sugar binding domain [Catalinimonas alkaloidigena]|uniref:Glycosyl hydrolases family 2, sugar binding domain n=1 Tax=Catalinimonas alkaloidigena TaxID=1075417 RepID=A0A1G9QEZ6_9BACT|nr:glycosyl hydrolase [Catalinimonas alkaloidigena]SDM09674.1 Glycosyl hydrolases family 2, sugar binding domain [Catalinimonas alkaloidigena]